MLALSSEPNYDRTFVSSLITYYYSTRSVSFRSPFDLAPLSFPFVVLLPPPSSSSFSLSLSRSSRSPLSPFSFALFFDLSLLSFDFSLSLPFGIVHYLSMMFIWLIVACLAVALALLLLPLGHAAFLSSASPTQQNDSFVRSIQANKSPRRTARRPSSFPDLPSLSSVVMFDYTTGRKGTALMHHRLIVASRDPPPPPPPPALFAAPLPSSCRLEESNERRVVCDEHSPSPIVDRR